MPKAVTVRIVPEEQMFTAFIEVDDGTTGATCWCTYEGARWMARD